MSDISYAISLLDGGEYLAVIRGEEQKVYRERGIARLLSLAIDDQLQGASVADTIVGKAAALLLAKGGVKEAYGRVMSRSGAAILEKYGIKYSYGALTDVIINRRGDGPCPMEVAVESTEDKDVAIKLISEALAKLRGA